LAATDSTPSALREATTTFAPASTNARAMASPIPRLPPVMIATLSFSSMLIADPYHTTFRLDHPARPWLTASAVRHRAALFVLLFAPAAHAQASGVDLAWDAPAECPDADAVNADIAGLVQGAPANPVRAHAHVARADEEWVLELVTETGAGAHRREL